MSQRKEDIADRGQNGVTGQGTFKSAVRDDGSGDSACIKWSSRASFPLAKSLYPRPFVNAIVCIVYLGAKFMDHRDGSPAVTSTSQMREHGSFDEGQE